MSATASTVLSLGYGSWGSVYLLPTLGFGIGIVATTPGQMKHGQVGTIGMVVGEVAKIESAGQSGEMGLKRGQAGP